MARRRKIVPVTSPGIFTPDPRFMVNRGLNAAHFTIARAIEQRPQLPPESAWERIDSSEETTRSLSHDSANPDSMRIKFGYELRGADGSPRPRPLPMFVLELQWGRNVNLIELYTTTGTSWIVGCSHDGSCPLATAWLEKWCNPKNPKRMSFKRTRLGELTAQRAFAEFFDIFLNSEL